MTRGILSDADLVRVFEMGEAAGPIGRAAALVGALQPDTDVNALELGDRDRLIWAFKRAQFGRGRQMMAKAECSGCGEWVSLDLGAGFDLPAKTSDSVTVQWRGQAWILRLPRQGDLAGASEGFPFTVLNPDAPWDDDGFAAAAEAAIDVADPGIDVVFDIACPDCGAVTACAFDAVGFVWRDIEALALRLFSEVATLARAFGWSEAETLRLTARRRARYVEMVT